MVMHTKLDLIPRLVEVIYCSDYLLFSDLEGTKFRYNVEYCISVGAIYIWKRIEKKHGNANKGNTEQTLIMDSNGKQQN